MPTYSEKNPNSIQPPIETSDVMTGSGESQQPDTNATLAPEIARPPTAEAKDGEAQRPVEQDKPIEAAPETKTTVDINKDGFLEEAIARLRQTLRGRQSKPTKVPQVRDEITRQIESIMSEGLTDAYRELTPVQQQEFKLKGEQAAWQIRTLLKQAKIKIKKIFQLLVEWLRLLPGVNRLFLEQEAKIKADKIFALHHTKRQ